VLYQQIQALNLYGNMKLEKYHSLLKSLHQLNLLLSAYVKEIQALGED
jgi:hypothetical protein